MAKARASFVCQNCGAVYQRWQGKCDACGELEHDRRGERAAQRRRARPRGAPARKGRAFALEPLPGETEEAPRTASGIAELDRVTGGGFVRGSVILIGGDPGIGKSTLLIQAAPRWPHGRARRLHLGRGGGRRRCACAPSGSASPKRRSSSPPRPMSRTSSRRCRDGQPPRLVVINSIQTHVDRRRRIRRPAR